MSTAERTGQRLTPGQTTWLSTVFAVVIGGLLWLSVAGDQWQSARTLFWGDLALGVASLAAMQCRRRWPLAVTILTVAATAVSVSAIGPWIVCQVSLSARRRWREILPTAALSVLAGQASIAVQPNRTMSWYVNLLFCVLAAGVVVAIGMYLGARRDLIASLHDRAERAEREQALQVSTARAGERTRIAREMHDVLAHRMSLVAVHAGALAYRTDLSAAETRETAAIIQANSQRALADLRDILGLLRDTERGIDVTHHRPQPTLSDLDSLLDDERAAGAHVTLRADLEDLDALPESIGRSAFRIIQEGLTNARKHAPHAMVTVELTGHPGNGLNLSVRNPVRVGRELNGKDGAGFGLVGLAERAAASHGRFEHGLTRNGDFVLRAWLPWER
ncbi:MAG TPA: histidine kinase [Candidatus Dormibacteraeota bacterium]|nr:histidine kinase [Candidatus Dormibacteraeota bacterium]